MPRDGGHAFTCPLALTEQCEGCGSAPGAPCFPFCYALLGANDDIEDEVNESDPIRLVAIVDDDPDEFIRWHRVVDLLRPLTHAGVLAAFTLNGGSSMGLLSRGVGWVDEHGMILIPHHPHWPLTLDMVLARRDHTIERYCPARRLVAVPVVVYPPVAERLASPTAVCVCGHIAAHHDGTGPAEAGCARWSGSLSWCGCLAFRAA